MHVGLRNSRDFCQAPFGNFPVLNTLPKHLYKVILQFSE